MVRPPHISLGPQGGYLCKVESFPHIFIPGQAAKMIKLYFDNRAEMRLFSFFPCPEMLTGSTFQKSKMSNVK